MTPWNKGRGINKPCAICGKVFYVWLAHAERVKCCSRVCGYKLRRSFKGENNPAWMGGYPSCLDCGVRLTQRNYKRCSRHRNSHNTGENNNRWKGGITPINLKFRSTPEYKQWRKSVFERDDYTCQECSSRGVELNADHIKPFAYFPELRLDINNGRTLCVTCHRATDTFAGRATRYA